MDGLRLISTFLDLAEPKPSSADKEASVCSGVHGRARGVHGRARACTGRARACVDQEGLSPRPLSYPPKGAFIVHVYHSFPNRISEESRIRLHDKDRNFK